MDSADDFEEKLQEEYGTIFNNIAYIRERKRKHRVRERENGKHVKNYCLTASYKKNEGKVELLNDELPQTTATLEQDMINTNKRTSSKTVRWQMEGEKGVSPLDSESRNCSLYEKVAMDLETVFNKYMTINPNPASEKSLEGEKSPETTLDAPNEHITEREKATLRNEIKYKTIHTKNDTLYIWTACV